MIGRSCVWFERAILGVREVPGTGVFDRTGLLVERAERIPVLHRDDEIVYPGYESAAHSLWRAQELSLLHQHRRLLVPPVLDFGCGDGSFAAILFDRIDIGVDNDPQALEVARGFGLYDRLVASLSELETGSVGSIFTNSVLEHVLDPDPILADLRRVLARGGAMLITVPTTGFRDQLARFFGPEESARINAAYYHRNLMSASQWVERLARVGFRIETVRHYQHPDFTYWYRMLRVFGRRALGRLVPDPSGKVWSRGRRWLLSMVRRSLRLEEEGANVFLVARAA